MKYRNLASIIFSIAIKKMKIGVIWLLLFLWSFVHLFAQNDTAFFPFRITKFNPVTQVKNQYKTSTCWSFSVASFLESEILRKVHDTIDLSEMYFVRKVYEAKAEKYVRMQGTISLSGGGVLNDVIDILPLCGFLPEQVYPASGTGGPWQDHSLMDKTVKKFLERIINAPGPIRDTLWQIRFQRLLDSFLGEVPAMFQWNGQMYSAQSFRESLGIDQSDYVVLTSFLHHPWYAAFSVEVPDNWNWAKAWNIPLDELEQTVHDAVMNGYTVAWASDISEPGFLWKEGLATLAGDTALHLPNSGSGSRKDNGDEFSMVYKDEPLVSQVFRQQEFDRHKTTDDHAMHIIGIAVDTAGKNWFVVKNSWGSYGTRFKGYLMVSRQYFRAKTLTVLLPVEALPENLKRKLNFKSLP